MPPPPPVDPVPADPDSVSVLGTFLGGLFGGLSVWVHNRVKRSRQNGKPNAELVAALHGIRESFDRAIVEIRQEHDEMRRLLENEQSATRKLFHEFARESRDWFRDLAEGQRIEAEVERRIAARELAARERGGG